MACLNVPHAHALVKRGGEHEVVPRVEAGRHDVVVVACEHLRKRERGCGKREEEGDAATYRHAAPVLPVPDADCLIVGCAYNPRVLGTA